MRGLRSVLDQSLPHGLDIRYQLELGVTKVGTLRRPASPELQLAHTNLAGKALGV